MNTRDSRHRMMKHPPCARIGGFTLIEIVLAVALGVVLLIGIAQMFSGVRNTYGFQENMARVQESGRIAMDLISRQVRLAGFRSPAWDDPPIGFYPLTGLSTDGGPGGNDALQIMRCR